MSDLKIELNCPICMGDYTDIKDVVINVFCDHAVCKVCYTALNNSGTKYRGEGNRQERALFRAYENRACKCPICRHPFIDKKEILTKYQSRNNTDLYTPPPPLHPLIQPIAHIHLPPPQPATLQQPNINRVPTALRDIPIPTLQPAPPQNVVINVNTQPEQDPHRSFGFENQARPRCLTRNCQTPRGTQRKCPNHHGVPCCRVCDTCFICKGILSRLPHLNNTSVITNPSPAIRRTIPLNNNNQN